MRILQSPLLVAALIASSALPLCRAGNAFAPSESNSVAFHFEAGITYASGTEKLMDQLENNFGLEKKSNWPVGLKATAYGIMPSGFGFGASVGPCMFVKVEDHHHYYDHDDSDTNYVIPLSVDARFYFPTKGMLAPYVRAGVTCPISGGKQVGSGSIGPVAAVGVHVWEHRIFSLGLEAGYDASKVEVKGGYYHGAEKVRPVGFNLSIFATF